MPFHSVDTEEEAESMIVFRCRRAYIGNRYIIPVTWDDQDILAAMSAARKHFNLLEE